MQHASIHDLRVNPAQMRTRINAVQLAQLALQMQAGFDRSLRLLIVQEDDHFRVISGHRRWLALMIGYLCRLDHEPAADAEAALEQMIQTVNRHCTVDEDGLVRLAEGLYTDLLSKIATEINVPVTVWEGSDGDEVMTLIRANMGAEEPDLLGQAHVFLAAVDRGILIRDLAEAVGMPEKMVEAIIAIPSLPQVFQDMLTSEKLGLEAVPDLLNLSVKQRRALGTEMKNYMSENVRSGYTGAVQLAAVQMRTEPQVLNPAMSRPNEHNYSYILRELWRLAEAKSPAALYKEAARSSFQGYSQTTRTVINALSKLPKLAQFFVPGRGYGDLAEDALGLLPDNMTCNNCVYSTLPMERLKLDFEVPCRESGKLPEAGRCLHCAPVDGQWTIRTPWVWDVCAGKDVKTVEALLDVWQKQLLYETKTYGAEAAVSVAGTSADMLKQRSSIRQFMDRHALPPFYVDHPWAMSCERCEYRCEGSPVKSAPDAPPCQWSKGRHNVFFEALIPSHEGVICLELRKMIPDGLGLVPLAEWPDFDPAKVEFVIPWCRQFVPTQPWSELVPESEIASPFPREVMVDMIGSLSKATNRNSYGSYSSGAVQFLTGQPKEGSHQGHFSRLFKKQKKELSDLQLWTLVQWLALQFTRVSSMTNRQITPVATGITMTCTIKDFATACTLWDEAETEDEG